MLSNSIIVKIVLYNSKNSQIEYKYEAVFVSIVDFVLESH